MKFLIPRNSRLRIAGQKPIKPAEGRPWTGFLPIRSGPKGSSRNKFGPGRWPFFHLISWPHPIYKTFPPC